MAPTFALDTSMGGELSKKIGDKGEKLAMDFFKRIGWEPISDTFNIDCRFPTKHQHKQDSPRKTHGVDLAFSYICPVARTVRRNVLISVKNSNDDDTRPIRAQIVNDLTDLSTALTCFNKSTAKAHFMSQGGATRVEDMGILLKINKDPDGEKSFLGDSVNRDPIDLDGDAPLCFVENDRFDFIDRCLSDVVQRNPKGEYSFVIPRSSLNSSPIAWKPHSTILPVQSLVGGPLVLRISQSSNSGSETELLMYSNECFSPASFKRIAGAAKLLTGDWVNTLLIFPDSRG